MIKFKKIKFKNFLSTGNYFSEIRFDKSSNTLVVGENGSGKSTMLDALCFVLFGKAFRSINKPQLINSINQKECVVECEFSIGKKEYRIVRGIKPNVFEIYCNNKLVNQDAASRDYQDYLEKFILKLNYKSFTQIVILGSASFVPFMQLSAADRRTIIEDLLDIQIFSTMNSLLKDRVQLNKENTVTNKHNIEMKNVAIELQESHIEKLKTNDQDLIKKYDEEIRKHNSNIQKLHAETAELLKTCERHSEEISAKTEVEHRLKKITKIESQIETNVSKFRKDISFFQQNDDCPTCRQEIALGFKEQQIENLKIKIADCEDGLKRIESSIIDEQKKLNTIVDKQQKIYDLQMKINTNNTTITETNKFIQNIQKKIEELKINSVGIQDEDINLNNLKTEVIELEKENKKLIEEKSYLDAASLLLKDTGIKTKIIKQYLPVINKLVNKYLASFDFFVNFNLDESFKETIKSRHRDEFSYASFSEGEKQRIDMALMLTWRAIAKLKNSANTNLLILDEVFDSSLDTNGTEYLMNILHLLEDVNLFVISHKGDILQDKFRSIVKFQKVNNFSRIVK
jgi:DNA repair exonuclease SbcCD ATPase subunit